MRRWPIWIALLTLVVTLIFLAFMFGMFWLLGTIPLAAFLAVGVIYGILSASRKPTTASKARPDRRRTATARVSGDADRTEGDDVQ